MHVKVLPRHVKKIYKCFSDKSVPGELYENFNTIIKFCMNAINTLMQIHF